MVILNNRELREGKRKQGTKHKRFDQQWTHARTPICAGASAPCMEQSKTRRRAAATGTNATTCVHSNVTSRVATFGRCGRRQALGRCGKTACKTHGHCVTFCPQEKHAPTKDHPLLLTPCLIITQPVFLLAQLLDYAVTCDHIFAHFVSFLVSFPPLLRPVYIIPRMR